MNAARWRFTGVRGQQRSIDRPSSVFGEGDMCLSITITLNKRRRPMGELRDKDGPGHAAQEPERSDTKDVLPDRLVKIHYYGLLGNSHRAERLQTCRRLLGFLRPCKRNDRPKKKPWHQLLFELTGIDPAACPVCGGRRRCLLLSGRRCYPGCRCNRRWSVGNRYYW